MCHLARSILQKAPQQFALASLSMGGITALEIMRQAPERITKLALLDTTARPMRPEQKAIWHRRMAMASEGQFAEMLEVDLMPSWLHPERQSDNAFITDIRQMAQRVGPEVFVRQAHAILDRPDSRPSLPQITCPTLIIVGRQDHICPVEVHEEMMAAIPRATLVTIEACGHLSPMEQPEAVTSALSEGLQADA